MDDASEAPPEPPAAPPDSRRRTRVAAFAAVVLAVVASALVVMRTTSATFEAGTRNGTNSWSIGRISLRDDTGGSALFSVTGLTPGDSGSRCVTLTYDGGDDGTAAQVRFFTTSTTGLGGVAEYLDLTVERGSGGGHGSCSGFSRTATDFDGTLADLGTAHTTWSSGLGPWHATRSGSTVYRISYRLDPAVPDSAQGARATTVFHWEART